MTKEATFISDEQIFINKKNELYKIFDNTRKIPENVFNKNFQKFLFLEFDYIYTHTFFNGLLSYLDKKKESHFTFFTTLPDPESFYLKKYGEYSIGIISVFCSYTNYCNFLHKEPLDLAATSDYVSLFSNLCDWGFWGSKDWEVAIIGFHDDTELNLFKNSFSKNIFSSINELYLYLNEILDLSDNAKLFYSKLDENYK